MTITKRGTKGSALTYAEMDENIRDLYEDTDLERVLDNGNSARTKSMEVETIYALNINAGPWDHEYAPQQLVLNAGESASYAEGQDLEFVYVNAEGGLQVSSHPNNWNASAGINLAAGWAGRKVATLRGDHLSVTGGATFDGGLSTTVDVLCDDGGTANIRLMGNNQGNGRLFVGQSTAHGGGIEYSGESNPALSGAGSDQIAIYRRSSNSNVWTARFAHNSNNWQFAGTTSENASDERLKENITLIPNALEKIDKLRGVTFDWKDDVEEKGFIPYAKHETGVIAQDVQKVIPDAALPAPFDENYLTVKTEKITPLLIECIKELKAEVQLLKNRVQELENA
jgi:hypothetical protein